MASDHGPDYKPARDARGHYLPGQTGNPGGRPKNIRSKIIAALGDEALERLVTKLVGAIDDFQPKADGSVDALSWFLDREWPKTQHIDVADVTEREAPVLDDDDITQKRVAELLGSDGSVFVPNEVDTEQ